jgi:NAD dependent epimerase/dehydratase family enzyme
MPDTMADLIETTLNVVNNLLSGFVNLGAPQPLTNMGSDLVNGLAHNAVDLAWFLAYIAGEAPIS